MIFRVSTQSTDLVSMVYSCIGAEIDDSDGSSAGDVKVQDDGERSSAISDALADTHSTRQAMAPCRQQQPESGRQERIVPLMQPGEDGEAEEANLAPGSGKPEPPPQSSKPSLAVMRQRHLQETSGTAMVSLGGAAVNWLSTESCTEVLILFQLDVVLLHILS